MNFANVKAEVRDLEYDKSGIPLPGRVEISLQDTASFQVECYDEEQREVIAELARRWNAYSKMEQCREALKVAIKTCEGLSSQQAMPDDWWKAELLPARRALAELEGEA